MCIRDKVSKLWFILLTRAEKEKGIKFGTTYSGQLLRCRSFQITLGHPPGMQEGRGQLGCQDLLSELRKKEGSIKLGFGGGYPRRT